MISKKSQKKTGGEITSPTDARDTDKTGYVVVISGPSGVGKSTICDYLVKEMGFRLSVSATTREPRKGEKDGVNYYFISKEEFEKEIREGAFIEYVKLFGNYYGTPLAPIQEALRKGRKYLLDIDVHGVIALREKGVNGVYILIAPPDIRTLKERLKGRKTETPEQLKERLKLAKWELKQKKYYDYVVVNNSLDETVKQVKEIVRCFEEKMLRKRASSN